MTDSGAVAASVTTIGIRPGRLGIRVTNLGGAPSNMFKSTPPEARRRTRPASDEHHVVARNSATDAEEQVRKSDYDCFVVF